jgi:cyclophilin family peptidyl-prolyl cis-trans isomerase
MTLDPAKTYRATFRTTKGAFEVELFPKDAPLAVNNFVCLARAGYFDATVFHRVVPGFVIQGGDPTASGRGGPGYRFPDEPIAKDYGTGTLAMANAGPNTNGSQFFVVLEGGSTKLQKLYTIFGQVIAGQEVVEVIGQTDPSVEPVGLESVTVGEG